MVRRDRNFHEAICQRELSLRISQIWNLRSGRGNAPGRMPQRWSNV